jgi:hypothetical protein
MVALQIDLSIESGSHSTLLDSDRRIYGTFSVACKMRLHLMPVALPGAAIAPGFGDVDLS